MFSSTELRLLLDACVLADAHWSNKGHQFPPGDERRSEAYDIAVQFTTLASEVGKVIRGERPQKYLLGFWDNDGLIGNWHSVTPEDINGDGSPVATIPAPQLVRHVTLRIPPNKE